MVKQNIDKLGRELFKKLSFKEKSEIEKQFLEKIDDDEFQKKAEEFSRGCEVRDTKDRFKKIFGD